MTPLALTFLAPWLLLGLLAAGIPVALHLLSHVRAPEVRFPTLRFLRVSMERTARRRRVQHWLLLVLRSLLLALLAIGVAQLIVRNGGAFGGGRYAAVLVIDDSGSMQAATADGATRLERARREALRLLDGDAKPRLASVLRTSDAGDAPPMTSDLAALRRRVDDASPTGSRAAIGQAVARAVRLLDAQDLPAKRVYVFSDLQEISFAELAGLPELAGRDDIELLFVDASLTEDGRRRPVRNVGVTDLQVAGRPVADQPLSVTATLTNAGATEARVTVRLAIDGRQAGVPQIVTLPGGNAPEAADTRVTFHHSFATPGPHAGQVTIEPADDLPADDVRHFALAVGDRADVLIVGGPPAAAAHEDGATVLSFALDPRTDPSMRWSLRPQVVRHDAFRPEDLEGAQAVFCADVPSFTPGQRDALEAFAARGGTLAIFLGNAVDAEAYNRALIDEVPRDGGLLPARLVRAIGDVGLTQSAMALDRVQIEHRWFRGLVEQHRDYRAVLTQRYFLVDTAGAYPPETLMRLEDGSPLLLSRPFGRGRVVLCTTTASLAWTKLPSVGKFLFVPMLERIALDRYGEPGTTVAAQGARVAIRPGEDAAAVDVILPDGQTVRTVPTRATGEGRVAEFGETGAAGIYRWRASGGGEGTADAAAGAFAINPEGSESRLAAMPAERLRGHLGERRTFVAPTLAAAHASAAEAAQGLNLSELFLVVAIVLLVVEARLSNRWRRREAAAMPGLPAADRPAAGREPAAARATG